MTDIQRPVEIFGIYDRGVPNQERIVLKVNRAVDLTYYALVLGVKAVNDTILPFRDNYFWFGKIEMLIPGWIFVYTGKGTPGISQETYTKEPAHSLYWNRPTVLLSDPDVIPAVFRMTDIHIGNKANKSISDLKNQDAQNADSDAFYQQLLLKLADNKTDAQNADPDTLYQQLLKLSDNSKKK